MCTGGYMATGEMDFGLDTSGCAVCGESEFSPSVEKAGYMYEVCSGCGVARLSPMPEESYLNELYEEFMELECDGVKMSEHFSLEFREAYFREKDLDFDDLAFEFRPGMKVLDVGCADGIFLKYLRTRFGIEGKGIDVSKKMAAMGVDEGLDCSVTPLKELVGRFDVISLWDTLEHLRNPVEALKEAERLLADDGTLIIQTPCRGVLSEAYGSDWIQYQPPYHLHIFDFESLTHLLKRTGFTTIRWVRFGAGITEETRVKPVFDRVAKDLGIGDTIVLTARKKGKKG